MSTDGITWIKATKSGDSGDCVELGIAPAQPSVVYLRDSKNKQGPVLTCTSAGIAALIDGAKDGEFDQFLG